MKRRRSCAIFLVFLVIFPTDVLSRELQNTRIQKVEEKYSHQRIRRQSDDIINTIIQLGTTLFPLILSFVQGSGAGGPAAQKPAGDLAKLPTIEGAKPDTKVAVAPSKADKTEDGDIFSWSNLLSVGVKVALALLSNYSSGGIDRNGNEISPIETVIGTLISAVTGSEDPQEVSKMARQATEVVKLVGSLVEALKTSFLS